MWNLIIINIEKPGWHKFVLSTLGYEEKDIGPFHRNSRKERSIKPKIMSEIKQNVSDCLKKLDYPGDEVFLKDDQPSNYPYRFYL